MEKVKITLTLEEMQELFQLVNNSCDTGNEEFDEIMKSIKKQIIKVI